MPVHAQSDSSSSGTLPEPQATVSDPQQSSDQLPSPTPIPSGKRAADIQLAPDCNVPFVDVPSYGSLYDAVEYMYCRRNVSGFDATHYGPDNNVTRAQFTKIAVEGFGVAYYNPMNDPDPLKRHPTFNDVPQDYLFFIHIESAHHAGMIDGYPDGNFVPNRVVTRGQMAKIVANAEGYTDTDYPNPPTFCDVPFGYTFHNEIERLAKHYVDRGFFDNYGGGTSCPPYPHFYFSPNNNSTRSELTIDTYRAVTTPSDHNTYDRPAAIAYADTWSTNHNEYHHNPSYDYFGYPNDGGDCTNFLSQSMYAGLMFWYVVNNDVNDTRNWYYRDASHGTSSSWINVEAMKLHAGTRAERFQHKTGIAQLNPGDFIQINQQRDPTAPFDHGRLMVGYGTPPADSDSTHRGMLTDQHTVNRYHVAWDYNIEGYQDEYLRFWHIVY